MERVDHHTLATVVAADPVVVEFKADWCVDCKRLAPAMSVLTEEYRHAYRFAEIDVDESRQIAEKYKVKGIPTFIIFKAGKEVARLTSREAKTQEEVALFLEKYSE
ncbi:co-chaperone YbbN [Mechercharimyces sp. CAU 1602]|uniref:thioredoxin family protein n=1 Tax=Mechercharimyces sp. CAU 1602 TaxID=2973933 RepID=UPI002162BE19|nr:thioredoxin family protein [Mechercharimyces sp. CAU 1602]